MVENNNSGGKIKANEEQITETLSSIQWDAKAGDTLLVPSGPSGNHLFVVLFDPQVPIDTSFGKKLHLAQVNFTSVRQGMIHDTSCIIESGEHEFISHKSYVNYRGLRYEEYGPIKRGVENGRLCLHTPVGYGLLCRIREGALISGKTPSYIKYEIQKLLDSLNINKSA